MGRLTARELAEKNYAAGFRGDSLITMTAVNLGESGGLYGPESQSHHPAEGSPNGRENSWGPAQIYLDVHTQVTREQAMDPDFSAAFSYELSRKGANFQPWSVWSNGTYRQFMGAAANAARDFVGEQDPIGEYTVQPGDTMYGIAAMWYGDGERWPELAAANGHNEDWDARTLEVGRTLKLPDKNAQPGGGDGNVYDVQGALFDVKNRIDAAMEILDRTIEAL